VLFGDELSSRLAEQLQESSTLRVVVVARPFVSGLHGFVADYGYLPCPMSWQVPLQAGKPMPPGFPCTVYRRQGDASGSTAPKTRVKFSVGASSGASRQGNGQVRMGARSESAAPKLNLIFDSKCAVCQWEVVNLRSLGSGDTITFTDCEAPDYDPQLPKNAGISYERAMARIHAVTSTGEVLDGIPVFAACYEQVGLGWLFAVTRAPLIGELIELGYSLFAKVRPQITRGASLEAKPS